MYNYGFKNFINFSDNKASKKREDFQIQVLEFYNYCVMYWK